jgi:beta-aspartyl-peptidase (threonine type)
MSYSLAIHGGAGDAPKNLPWSDEDRLTSLHEIMEAGEHILSEGGSAMDAVKECVCLLEDDIRYNAGYGAVPNESGEYELDASIMDGETLKAGSVTSIKDIKNPVKLAARIITETHHIMLSGEHAMALAKEWGLEFKDHSYFQEARDLREKLSGENNDLLPDTEKHGTVGAVAYDINGNLAAATSTGGIKGKMPGRISDSAIIGSGNLADNRSCAISCTGVGEHFIRTRLAERIASLIDIGKMDANAAATSAAEYLVERVNGNGAFILIDKNGNVAAAQSSNMCHLGWLEHGGDINVALECPIKIVRKKK